jgi:hypothetical protein
VNNIKKEETRGRNRILIPFIFLILLTFTCISAASAAPGDTIYVNGTGGNDSWDGQSDIYNSTTGSGPKLSIRNATGTVNSNGTVHIADGVYSGVNNTGITIDKNMNIMCQSQALTVIDGYDAGQIFIIQSGVNVTIQGLTLSNVNTLIGGAIINYGNLIIGNSTLSNNTANNRGGAIYNYGSLIIGNSTLRDNIAYIGGAIYNRGSLIIGNSTLRDNIAYIGGAIFNGGSLILSNSTLSNNTANSDGGAIYNYAADLMVNFNRIVGNTAYQGNAIYNYAGTVNVEKNWWGSNADPKTIPNLIVVNSGSVNTDTWLILTVNANPNTTITGQSTITADFNHINGGGDLIGGCIPDGIPVTFSSTFGLLDPLSAFTSNGQATSLFMATHYSGIGSVYATVDGLSLSTPITVNNAEIYVSNNTGSDVTGDGSLSNPFQSILKGIEWLSSGGNLHIAEGVYSGVNNTGITIDKNMNIIGQSQALTVIDGLNNNQIFNILSGVNVTIQDLTLSNAQTFNGGAISNWGSLTLTNSTLSNNIAYDRGGAISNWGSLTIINSRFYNNSAGFGGSIFNNGSLTLSNSTLYNNIAYGLGGGAIFNNASSTISNSVFSNNTADNGGAIFNRGNLNISNTTLSDNIAIKFQGGAIFNDYGGNLTITNTTFNSNTAANYGGGAIFNAHDATLTITKSKFNNNSGYSGGAIYNSFGNLTISNSILSGNTANKYGGAISNFGGNLTANFNYIVGNTANEGTAVYNMDTAVNAEKNWWGSNADPKTIPNLIFVNGGSVNTDTWVILTVKANPNTINAGQKTNITADFNHINGGGDLIGGYIPDGIPVTFTTDWGSFTHNSNTTVNGEARTTFQANGISSPTTNPVKVYAAADSEISTYAPVTIIMPTKLILNKLTAYKGKIIKINATLWNTYYKQPVSGQKVTFKIDGKIIGSAITNANGVATINYKDLTGKTSTITAEFAGSKLYANSKNVTQLIGEKKFAITVKNTGKSRIHVVYYVTVYKPNKAKPIFKKYNFYLNPGKTKKITIGTYPVETAVSSDQFIYNKAYNQQKVSLINIWAANGLKAYLQKFMVKNVPSKQKRAVYAKNRFWINKNALNVLIVKKPRIK